MAEVEVEIEKSEYFMLDNKIIKAIIVKHPYVDFRKKELIKIKAYVDSSHKAKVEKIKKIREVYMLAMFDDLIYGTETNHTYAVKWDSISVSNIAVGVGITLHKPQKKNICPGLRLKAMLKNKNGQFWEGFYDVLFLDDTEVA